MAALASRPGATNEQVAKDDSARRESFWATFKTELIDGRLFASRAQARREVSWYIEVYYNRARLHGALGYNSPVDLEHSLS